MRTSIIFSLPFLAGFIIFLSTIALFVNYFIFQYPGNSFFPVNMPLATIIILLINIGLVLIFGIKSKFSHCGIEFLYFFIVMSIIALASNAVQLTPFSPIDKKILALEQYFYIDIPAILAWCNKHPTFKNILGFIYDTLPYQMSLLPIIVILTGKFNVLKEYYFLMFITTLIGFSFYYFFPTTAPASVINSPFFFPGQIATGLKFNQIHHHINPTTDDGGLIALPSFHSIWALLCVFLLKEWPIPCVLLLTINILLIASCVLLGWHYVIDIAMALIVVGISYYLLDFYRVK